MTDHTSPDYPLDESLELESVDQMRALFEATRLQIVDLLSERAATTTELAQALDRPKGTVGHHLGVLERAGLVHVVRTEKVRALEAKYYGRTARHFLVSRQLKGGLAPDWPLTTAAAELAAAAEFAPEGTPSISTVRYARISPERAGELKERLEELVDEFVGQTRRGDTVWGLAVALYPTRRPRLPEGRSE